MAQHNGTSQTASQQPDLAKPQDKDTGPDGQLVVEDDYGIRGRPDVAAEVDYFLSIPWCRSLLRPNEGGKTIRIVQPDSRRHGKPRPNPDGSFTSDCNTVDNVFTTTLNTHDTFRAFILFFEEPPASPASPAAHPEYRGPIVELKALLWLGPGLNGHIGICHGGIVATILDEVLGLIIPLNRARLKHNARTGAARSPSAPPWPPAEAAAEASARIDTGYVTGYLNTSFLMPVRTNAPILATSRYIRLEGTRKYYMEGAIWDDKGQLLAKTDCVYIALKEKL